MRTGGGGEYNASWLLWMGKSIGSRHLFNNGRAAHDETERWMDISGTTTSLKKDRTKRKEKWIRNILSFLMTYLSSHLSILFSYVANSVPDFWTHSYAISTPWWFLRWACPQLTPTFWHSDICELWYPLGYFLWKRIYANVSIGEKIYNILPLGLSFFLLFTWPVCE